MDETISDSRTYVVFIIYGGKILVKKFTLPPDHPNASKYAAWYYMNRIDRTAMMYFCMSYEAYSNISEVEVFA